MGSADMSLHSSLHRKLTVSAAEVIRCKFSWTLVKVYVKYVLNVARASH